MSDSTGSDSPLGAVSGVAGNRATEAFSTLGNETRLSILLALWEAYEPLSEDNFVSFSELRDRVGMRDSGQFNYHLDQLTGHFVRSTEDGYSLRESGQKLVRSVIAGTGIGESSVPPTELDMTCHHCGGGPVAISYDDEMLYLVCPDCDGFLTFEDFPDGLLAVWDLDPAGLIHRDPDEILVTGAIVEKQQVQMMAKGVCPDCSGEIETSVRICSEHEIEPGSVCPHCEMRDSARVRFTCSVCKNWNGGPVEVVILDHPAVVAFYHERGIDNRYDIDDVEDFFHSWERLWQHEHEVVSADPVRIRITVPCEGDELHLILDGELDVIEVDKK